MISRSRLLLVLLAIQASERCLMSQEIRPNQIFNTKRAVWSVAVAGESIFVLQQGGAIDVYGRDGKEKFKLEPRPLPNENQSTLAISSDNQRLACSMPNGTIWIYDASNGKRLRVLQGVASPSFFVTFSRDGKVAASEFYGQIRIWSPSSEKPESVWKAHSLFATYLSFEERDDTIISIGIDNAISTRDLKRSSLISQIKTNENVNVLCADRERISESVFFGGRDRRVWKYDLKQRTAKPAFDPDCGVIYALATFPKTRLIAVGGEGSDIRIWDWQSRAKISTLPEEGVVSSLLTTPSGELVSGTRAGTVKIWPADCFTKHQSKP